MTDLEALHWAVLTDPADDTARLVYADALEEADDPGRARFIRREVANGMPVDVFVVGKAAEYPYLTESGDAATVEIAPPVPGVSWGVRRGFAEEVYLRAEAFTDDLARDLFSQHPITAVRVLDREPIRDPEGTYSWYTWYRVVSLGEPAAALLPVPWAVRMFQLQLVGWNRTDKTPSDAPGGHTDGYVLRFRSPTRKAAHDALSDALVDIGRRLAGLPPLPPYAHLSGLYPGVSGGIRGSAG